MTKRRTAAFFCLGLLLFAALLPGAIVFTLPLFDDAGAPVDASGFRCAAKLEPVASPLLERITPRHLARASLRSFAA